MTTPAAEQLRKDWQTNPRWKGVERAVQGRGRRAAARHACTSSTRSRAWAPRSSGSYCNEKPFVNALGALTGNQAMQQVKAGLEAIYLSGWQVAGDANLAGEMYPDQSLYPANSVPAVVRRINNALLRADQIHHAEGNDSIDWFEPIVADAEAGFGGVLNAFELMKGMIEAGAAGVHFEDQLSSAKKCGHMGGKVLVPTSEAISKLAAARLAADTCGVPTVLVARTDAESANLLTTDVDERDRPFITAKERTREGFFYVNAGLDQAIARGLAYAPYADLIWCETGKPDLDEAKQFAEGDPQASSRASCWRTTARRRSTGRRSSTTRRSRSSSASWARWATSSSSSRWPASTRSTTRCSSWRAATRRRRWRRTSQLQEAGVRRREGRLHARPSTSAKSAPATSTT